jgi:hypothetical protein
MKKDYTHIAIILDRTGSMEAIRDDTIGGFNAFLSEQKAAPGSATLTLVQFDSQGPYEVIHRFEKLEDVPELTRETFVPRASTPLLDAMGRGITDLEQRIAEMKDKDRPERIVMVIITDGQENASREFTMDRIEKMIREKQDVDGWQFVFLSADMDGIKDAHAVGIRRSAVMAYDKTARGTSAAWKVMSDSVSDYRAARKKNVEFSKEDREKQESEKN